MTKRWVCSAVIGLLGLALGLGLGTAIGQQAPPTVTKGQKVPMTVAIDLGPEIEGMQGWQLRLRLVELEPGGVTAVHTHKGRPAVAHVLKGTLTEYREGGYVKQHPTGDKWSEGKETTHWAENKGTEPVVFVVGDILKP
jgi:quercetin dioxygenase-like cupin family protein